MRDFRFSDEEALLAFGKRLSKLLYGGDFLALHGELGAGKTVLTRGIASGYGISEVLSPTFNIVHEYHGALTLYHFDAYRLHDADELYAMGYTDYLTKDALVVMEWAELVAEALPSDRLDITITGSGMEQRSLTAEGTGWRSRQIEAQL